MKNAARSLLLLALSVLLPCARAQAITIVDDFSVSISPIAVNFENSSASANSTITIGSQVNVLRDIEESVNLGGAASVSVAGGIYSLTAMDAQDTINTIAYSNFTLDLTEDHFLRFDFIEVLGLDQLVLTLGSGAQPTVDDLFSIPNSGSPFSYFIDLSLLPGWTAAFASGVDTLTVLFGSSSDNLVVELTEVSFTSIPEPNTAALIVLGLSALVAGRRRRHSLRPAFWENSRTGRAGVASTLSTLSGSRKTGLKFYRR